jgi:WD40 repeat protein
VPLGGCGVGRLTRRIEAAKMKRVPQAVRCPMHSPDSVPEEEDFDSQRTIPQWGPVLPRPQPQPSTSDDHKAEPRPIEPPPLSRIAHYELIEEIGRGGMGVVFKARDVRLGRVVALKMILGGALARPEDLQRFENESQAAAKLQHPNIVALWEVGAYENQPYFSMEYISGTSLSERVTLGPLPGARAAIYLEATARALDYAHGRGIIHRDLKPGNILLDEHDQPKVTDFGLAKLIAVDSGQTRTGAVLGTPSYMSPEQAAGRRDLGPAVDIYSLGAILYELLTGKPPFAGATPLATVNLVAEQEPLAPRLLNPAVDIDLETICLKCLEKDPHRRYASAGALADDLRRFLDGKPIAARRLGPIGRAIKWCRRNPAWATVGTLAVLAVGGFVGFVIRTAHEEGALLVKALDAEKTATARELAMRALLYAAEVRRVQRAVERADKLQADKLLKHWLPRSGQDDPRDWDWYFLNQWAETRLAFGNHPGQATAVAFDPSGRQLASTGGEAGTPGDIKVLAVPSGRLVHVLKGHTDVVTALAYHPRRHLLASASLDRTIRLWNLDKADEVRVLQGHTGPVRSLAFSPDGTLLASGGDRTVRLWHYDADPTDQGRAVRVLKGHTGEVTAVAFAPDGTRLASGSRDRSIRFWNVADGKETTVLRGHKSEVLCLAFSPRGELLASGGGQDRQEGEVRTWEVHSGKPLFLRYGLSPRILSLAYARDGKLAVAGSDGVIRIWDEDLAGEAHTFRGDPQMVDAVAFSPDGQLLVSAGGSGRVSLWNSSGGLETLSLTAPASLQAVAFGPKGKRLAAAGKQGVVALWDISDPSYPQTLREVQRADVLCLAFAPDGHTLVTGGADHTARIVDLAREQPQKVLHGHGGPVTAVAFRPDGHLLATAAATDDAIRLWDPATGTLHKLLHGNTQGVQTLAFSPSGARLAAAGSEGTIHLWDVSSGQEVLSLSGPRDGVNAVAFNPEGRSLAAAGNDKAIRVWDLANVKESPRLFEGSTAAVQALAWHPGGRRLASTGPDRIVRVWDIVTRQEILDLYDAGGAGRCIAFSPDGRSLAGAGDGAVRIWDAGAEYPRPRESRAGG